MAQRSDKTGSALFRETRLDQWSTLLSRYGVSDFEVQHDKNQIKLCCVHPNHNDQKPSATINVAYGNYMCWSCKDTNDTVFDPIQLVSIIAGQAYHDAYETFVDVFDLRPGRSQATDAFQKSSKNRRLLKDMMKLLRLTLDEIYDDDIAAGPVGKRKFRSEYYKILSWLKKHKVTPSDLKHCFEVGVLVDPMDFATIAANTYFKARRTIDESKEVVDFYKMYFSKVMSVQNFGAALMPYYLTADAIGRIQIRVDFLNPGSTVKFFFVDIGDKAPDDIKELFNVPTGFYGLSSNIYLKGDFSTFVTEGVTDLFAAVHAQMDTTGSITQNVIAVPGMGAEDVDRLTSVGLQELCFLQDNSNARGDSVVKRYIKSAKKLDVKPILWDPNSPYKDISEMYLSPTVNNETGANRVHSFVFNDEAYKDAHTFILDEIEAEVTKQGLGPEFTAKLVEEGISKIGSPAGQKAFIFAAERRFSGVSARDLEKEIAMDDDTLEGFMLRLRRDILDEFDFLYKEMDYNENRTMVAVLKKSSGIKTLIPLSSTSLVDFVAESFKSRTEWAEDARMPNYMRFVGRGKAKNPATPTIIRKEMNGAIREVLDSICFEVPMMNDPFADLGQGVHRVVLNKKEKILFVNGNDRYIGEFTTNYKNDDIIIWENYCPEIVQKEEKPQWSKAVETIEDLKDGNKIDPKELWWNVFQIINTGWSFKDQQEDVTWLTALTLYAGIYDFSDRTLFTVITGERESGKSKLVKEFLGGKLPWGSNMPTCEFFNYMEFPSTTEAGIRQEFAGHSGVNRRGLVLDEFENDSPKAFSKMDSMFGIFRGMLDGEANVVKGTKSGHKKRYNLRFPVVTAGILEYNDPTGAVESRIYRVQTKSEGSRLSPAQAVAQKFPGLDGHAITKSITVGMLRFAQKAREEARAVIEKANQGGFASLGMTRRHSDRAMIAAATIGGIMRVCGFNWAHVEVAINKILCKITEHREIKTEVPGERLWNSLLSTMVSIPEKPQDGQAFDMFSNVRNTYNRVTLNDALLNPDLRCFIGKKDFFQAFNMYNDGKYMVIDRYYLKDFLKSEDIDWQTFCTMMTRQFTEVPKDDFLKAASSEGHYQWRKSSKKYICIYTPKDIVEAWKHFDNKALAEAARKQWAIENAEKEAVQEAVLEGFAEPPPGISTPVFESEAKLALETKASQLAAVKDNDVPDNDVPDNDVPDAEGLDECDDNTDSSDDDVVSGTASEGPEEKGEGGEHAAGEHAEPERRQRSTKEVLELMGISVDNDWSEDLLDDSYHSAKDEEPLVIKTDTGALYESSGDESDDGDAEPKSSKGKTDGEIPH